MQIDVDGSVVPPAVSLEGADDLTSLRLVVSQPEHAFIPVAELRRLAGERAQDPEWERRFEAMVAYAEQKGWTREDGAIRVHVERA